MNYRQEKKAIIFVVLLVSFLLGLNKYIYADDGYVYYQSGSNTAILGDNEDISMDYEKVDIKLDEFTYTVDAYFEFYNHGVTTTIAVGFPKNKVATNGFLVHSGGKDNNYAFRTWVNGNLCYFIESIPRRNIETQGLSEQEGSYYSWLVKNVEFKENTKTTTRVKYIASYGLNGAAYIFGTGKSWKGPIGKAEFNVCNSSSIWVHNYTVEDVQGAYSVKRTEKNSFQISFNNVEPNSEYSALILRVSRETQPWEYYNYYDSKEKMKNSIYDFLGIPLDYVQDRNWTDITPENGDVKYNLVLLNIDQSRMLRNSFYAMHGKVFYDENLEKYFRAYFPVNPSFKESDLSKSEQKAIKQIKDYEDELNIFSK